MSKFVSSAIWVLIGLVGGWVINEIVYWYLNRPSIGVNLMTAFLPAAGGIIFQVLCCAKALLIFKGGNLSPLVPEKYKDLLIATISIYWCLVIVTKIYFDIKY